MPALDQDLIAAIATPPGQGGIGIVRLSGPGAHALATDLCGVDLEPRLVKHVRFVDEGETLDEGLALYFAAPRSFTGEEVVELHGHGGPVVLQRLLNAVCARGARLARPGEFSERAFHNGKLDLAQAEAIADLIASTSLAAARAAVHSLQGDFSRAINALADELAALRVLVEAAIDFPDEDVEILGEAQVAERTTALHERLAEIFEQSRQGALLSAGINVALLGAPNVGKSSLLNVLAGEEAAIVTDIPGTTRDLLKVDLVLEGLPIRLVDTAGLREARDPVEEIGVERAAAQAQVADLVLWVTEATAPPTAPPATVTGAVLVVRNKIDLVPGAEPGRVASAPGDAVYAVSARTGAGLDVLRRAMLEAVGFSAEQAPFTARARHLAALEATGQLIGEAESALAAGASAELIAESLRHAHDQLGEIVGTVTPDDLLGRIFSEFCIGK